MNSADERHMRLKAEERSGVSAAWNSRSWDKSGFETIRTYAGARVSFPTVPYTEGRSVLKGGRSRNLYGCTYLHPLTNQKVLEPNEYFKGLEVSPGPQITSAN